MEQQRGVRIGLQFAALAAVEVGVEHEAARIVRLEQHGARRGPAAGVAVATVIAVRSGSPAAVASANRASKVARLRRKGHGGGSDARAIVARMPRRRTLLDDEAHPQVDPPFLHVALVIGDDLDFVDPGALDVLDRLGALLQAAT